MSNLTTIKAKLDKVHNNYLTLHARAMAKPRYSGGVSSRPAPNGPAFLSLWKLHTKVLEALLSRFSDNKATISGGLCLKAGYEAGFQAGFQQCIALSQLPIQACITIPLSSHVPMFISPNGQWMLGHTTPTTSWENMPQPLATIVPSEIDWIYSSFSSLLFPYMALDEKCERMYDLLPWT